MSKTAENVNSVSEPVRILIVEDHPLVIDGLKTLIEQHDDYTVTGEVSTVDDALKAIDAQKPDLLLVDITLKTRQSGLDLLAIINERSIDTKAIILSMHEQPLYADKALKLGAAGYVLKHEASQVIMNAMKQVLEGDIYLSPLLAGKLVSRMYQKPENDSITPEALLSNREIEIFELFGRGLSTHEIAEKLGISGSTIDTHRSKIKEKLNIQKNSELMRTAVEWVLEMKKL